MSLCVLLMILQRVVVLLCCGLLFGIAMPAYNRTWGYVRTFARNKNESICNVYLNKIVHTHMQSPKPHTRVNKNSPVLVVAI